MDNWKMNCFYSTCDGVMSYQKNEKEEKRGLVHLKCPICGAAVIFPVDNPHIIKDSDK